MLSVSSRDAVAASRGQERHFGVAAGSRGWKGPPTLPWVARVLWAQLTAQTLFPLRGASAQ